MDEEPAAPVASQETQDALAEGYRQMAASRERELEAEEWTEQVLYEPE